MPRQVVITVCVGEVSRRVTPFPNDLYLNRNIYVPDVYIFCHNDHTVLSLYFSGFHRTLTPGKSTLLIVDYSNFQNIFLLLKSVGMDFFFLLVHFLNC